MTAGFSIFRYDHDGLRLAGRLYGALGGNRLPLVCLSGLTRNARDFHEFALAVQRTAPPRAVVAFDYRGRGLSDRAPDPSAYTLPAEMADIVAGLAHLGIARAVFVGTSRGALLLHLLALARPDLIAGAVLNDAGPKLEMDGLLAIKAYVGRAGLLQDWKAATVLVARINRPTFPALSESDFERMARANFRQTADGVLADYDPHLADTLAGVDAAHPLPELWDAYAALSRVPLLVVRGERSTLLSRETVERMTKGRPDCRAIEVPGQGHAPLLETPGLPEAIMGLAARIET